MFRGSEADNPRTGSVQKTAHFFSAFYRMQSVYQTSE